VGLVSTLMGTVTSGLAGVYLEKVLRACPLARGCSGGPLPILHLPLLVGGEHMCVGMLFLKISLNTAGRSYGSAAAAFWIMER
jgi:hypothetical protein